MITSIHKIRKINGKLTFADRNTFDLAWAEWPENEIGYLHLIPYDDKDTTAKQYGFLFGFLIPQISEAYGEPEEVVKNTLTLGFHPVIKKQINPKTRAIESVTVGGSLSREKCTRRQLSDVIDGAIVWCERLGINVPTLDDWCGYNQAIVARYQK